MVSSLLTFLSYARKSKETATLADTPENEMLTRKESGKEVSAVIGMGSLCSEMSFY